MTGDDGRWREMAGGEMTYAPRERRRAVRKTTGL